MDLISEDRLRWIAGDKDLNLIYLEKDYFLTLLLYFIKDVDDIYLKGGTAVNKLFLEYRRLSEDLDFTSRRDPKEVVREVEKVISDKKGFVRLEEVSSVDNYTRAKVFYKSYFQEEAAIILDINGRASLHLETEEIDLPNFYDLDFKVKTVNRKEILAEKVRALITRNQPRDYYDVYFLVKEEGVDWDLVKKKVKEAGEEYDRERIFKNAQKVYSRWEEDLESLTREDLDFKECIRELKRHLV